jgi:hypothetical protein
MIYKALDAMSVSTQNNDRGSRTIMKIVLAITLAIAITLIIQVRLICVGSHGELVVPLKGSMTVKPSGNRTAQNGYQGIQEHPVCGFYRTGAATVDGKW